MSEEAKTMDAQIVIFIIVGFILVGGLGWLAWLQEKKRREALFLLAQEFGLTYLMNDPFRIEHRYEGFACIDRGHQRSARNVLHGPRPKCTVTVFDFTYYTTSGSGKNRREDRHDLTALAADLDVMLPGRMLIRPEGFFDRLSSALGFDDIDFESEEFSRRFHVSAEDKKFAYDIVHVRAMEYLLENRGWNIEMRGRTLMFWTGGGNWEPDGVRQALGFADGFLELVPEYVWRDLKGADPGGRSAV